MAKKFLWLLLAVTLGVLLDYAWRRRAAPAAAPAPAVHHAAVPIQDRKTIAFSNGDAVVKDAAADRAAMETAVKEMNAAVKDVTFAPTPTEPKPAAPEKTPSK